MAGGFSVRDDVQVRDRAPIERFVDRLSARDVDAVTAMSAPYARVVMPYRTPGFPTEMSGDEQIREALTILDVYEHAPFAVRLLAIGSEAGSDRH